MARARIRSGWSRGTRTRCVRCAAIWLDAGTKDECYLDNGAVAVSKELEAIGVEHTLELFDAGHMSIGYRYPRSLAFLARVLTEPA